MALLESCRGYLRIVAEQEDRRRTWPRGSGLGPGAGDPPGGLPQHRDVPRPVAGLELLAWLSNVLRNHMADLRPELPGLRRSRRIALEAADRRGVGEGRRGPLALRDGDPRRPGRAAKGRAAALLSALGGGSRSTFAGSSSGTTYDRLTFDEIGRRLGRSAESARKLWTPRALVRLSRESGPALDPGI